MTLYTKLVSLVCLCAFAKAISQNTSYWQQHVDYTMEIDVNAKAHQYSGKQTLVYTNNSPDTLDKVFYHLYLNAFQPGSEMDVRSLNIVDPDSRVGDRISKLQPDEIGYIKVSSLKQDGVDLNYQVAGTVLEVKLDKAIAPGQKTTFIMDFNAQVPKQVRRTGRDNKEGVEFSMTQWYPKLAEYDFEGWHADPYIAREFHGVWGDFDVKITIDSNYVLGGTGYIQNPNEVGHGYQDNGVKVKKKKKTTWHFKAPKVHDFTWAADPDYLHDIVMADNGVKLHFLYQNDKEIIENWKKLQPKTVALLNYFNTHIGQYPYKQYSVIQGGDGGMEYAMCTLITGKRKFGSLVGVTAHELAHTWFQFLLATNEAKHEWMDEGFTTYISTAAMDTVMGNNNENPWQNAYKGYYRLATSGKEQPQTTHADRYDNNFAYGVTAYNKGAVFLAQLNYVIGKENVVKTLKKYFNDFAFKHPTPNDIKRTAEKVSGIQLGWYLTDWTQTTNTVDYSIESVTAEGDDKTKIKLTRKNLMPMPIDLYVTTNTGTESYYIPLRMMRAEKPNPTPAINRTQAPDWPWTNPSYELIINAPYNTIQTIEIDPSKLMTDIHQEDNKWVKK